MKIFVVEQNGDLTSHKGKSIVVEFDDGKILELAESPAPLPPTVPDGLHVWGGREPIPGLPLEKAKERTECLGLYPLGANVVHVFPYKLD